MHSPGNAWKPQIWTVSLSQNNAKMRKINRLTIIKSVLKVVISVQSCRPFPPCVSGKCPETSPDRPKNGRGWPCGPTDLCTGGKRVIQSSDGQPENIMLLAPKGGIKMNLLPLFCEMFKSRWGRFIGINLAGKCAGSIWELCGISERTVCKLWRTCLGIYAASAWAVMEALGSCRGLWAMIEILGSRTGRVLGVL